MRYKRYITPYKLETIEGIRKVKKRRIKINVIHFFAILAGAIIAIILLQNNDNKILPPIIFLFLVTNFFYTLYIYFKIHKSYETVFYENILTSTILREIRGVKFIPKVEEDDIREIWQKSQPFKSETLGYISNTKAKSKSIGFKGIYQGLDFEFYDVTTYKNSVTYTSGRNESNNQREFKGFLMRVKREAKLDKPVFVVDKNNTLHNPVSNFINSIIYNDYNKATPPNKVDLGYTNFEEKLSVYSESQEIAKQIITKRLAEQLLKSFKEINYPWYNITFIDDQVYAIMYAPFGLFQVDLNTSVSDNEQLKDIIDLITQKIDFLRILSK